MAAAIQDRKYPLRFLLYLEWILLGIVICSEFFSFSFTFISRFYRIPLLNLVCLFIFGIMGLKLPRDRPLDKIIYTGSEFGLIILASMVGRILLIPLLYTILITRNCLIFQGLPGTFISGLAVILSLLTQIYRINSSVFVRALTLKEQLLVSILISVLSLGIGAIFIQMAVNAILKEFHNRQELSQANEQLAVKNAQLRSYALSIEELATFKERNRIARDIHDSVGHALTVLNLHLEAALKLWQSDPAEATEFLAEAKQLGSRALQEVRQSVAALQIDPLAGLSFQEAIAALVQEFQRSSGIEPTLEINVERSIKNEIKLAAYRILQEALTNIYKHADATAISIQIQTNNKLLLTVIDNGIGFEPERNTTGFGLQSMRDRALSVGGYLEVITAPTAGCKIIASLPIA